MTTSADSIDVRRSLVALAGVDGSRITAWLDRAESFLGGGDVPRAGFGPKPPLADRIVAHLFMEDSTRTRLSFEVATLRLGGGVIAATAAGSSISKGESLLDTARNLAAMGADAIVVRTGASGGAAQIAQRLEVPVVNGGDGRHEHPTQALLDLLTLRRAMGSLQGVRVGIVGDIANSRVARSDVHGLRAVGAEPVLIGPPTLVPRELAGLGDAHGGRPIEIEHDFDRALPTLGAVIMLRMQRERAAAGAIAVDYPRGYRLNRERAAKMPDRAPILHPGPVNRGYEIEPEVADDPRRSLVLRQVGHGVAVRMAVLESMLAT
ncbi:MAG: aspartate carbamoyltransferase catalytic subunit [Phycisphaerales bacterium]|jgi:aspartate carbamoyltransferase catalytic subunit